MSLFLDLRITTTDGSVSLGELEIVRITNTDSWPNVDTVSTYKVLVGGVQFGHVQHRYGDGAWRLVALAAEHVRMVERGMATPT